MRVGGVPTLKYRLRIIRRLNKQLLSLATRGGNRRLDDCEAVSPISRDTIIHSISLSRLRAGRPNKDSNRTGGARSFNYRAPKGRVERAKDTIYLSAQKAPGDLGCSALQIELFACDHNDDDRTTRTTAEKPDTQYEK